VEGIATGEPTGQPTAEPTSHVDPVDPDTLCTVDLGEVDAVCRTDAAWSKSKKKLMSKNATLDRCAQAVFEDPECTRKFEFNVNKGVCKCIKEGFQCGKLKPNKNGMNVFKVLDCDIDGPEEIKPPSTKPTDPPPTMA